MAFQFGLFARFKLEDLALLVWGERGAMVALERALRQLAAGAAAFELDEIAGARSVDGSAVRFETSQESGVELVRGATDRLVFRIPRQELIDFAEQMSAVDDTGGHAYAGFGAGGSVTLVVSAGEYPVSLRP